MSARCENKTRVGDVCIVDGDQILVVPDTCVSFAPSTSVAQPLACATAIRDRLLLAQKCYSITLSPYGDISDACVKDVCNALKKSVNRFIVLEHGTSCGVLS